MSMTRSISILNHTDTINPHTTSRALNPKEWPHWGDNQNVVALYRVRSTPASRLILVSDIVILTRDLKSTSSSGQHIRTERFVSVMDYTTAFTKVSEFYTDKSKFGAASESFKSGGLFSRPKLSYTNRIHRKVDGSCGRSSEESCRRPCPCN